MQLGLVYSYLPFMILPLYGSLSRLDESLVEAAADLGARPWRILFGVIVPLVLPGIAAGALLVFIPAVGEFVIPDLLGGPDTLMIGKLLWQEFFDNVDWPAASAIAVALVAVLSLPLLLAQRLLGRRGGGVSGGRGLAALRAGALATGLGFLYLPIAVLIAYSFNGSRLVTIWGGFSTRWYGALIEDEKFLGAALTSLEDRRHGGEPGAGAGHRRRARDEPLRPVSRPRAVRLHADRAARRPRGDPRPVAAAAVRRRAERSRLAGRARSTDRDDRARHLRRLFCRGAGAGAAGGFRPQPRRGGVDLGARPWTVLWRITLPGISPALVSGWLLAFTMSLDDLVIASFVSGPAATTLPMAVYSSVRIGVTPEINALATVFLAVVFAIVASAFVLMARQEKRRRAAGKRTTCRTGARLIDG